MTDLIDYILSMLKEHWFWGAVTIACMTWYSTVTIYVTIKGAADIRNMLRKLSNGENASAPPSGGSGSGSR